VLRIRPIKIDCSDFYKQTSLNSLVKIKTTSERAKKMAIKFCTSLRSIAPKCSTRDWPMIHEFSDRYRNKDMKIFRTKDS
jgi:hypothetical protein